MVLHLRLAETNSDNPTKHWQTQCAVLEDVLTPRELEITRLAAEGLTNKEIALTLEISHWTVATHLRRVFEKAHVKRRAALSMVLLAGRAQLGTPR